ncbi:MAG: ABC transporter permease [archaeon]
MTLPLTKPALLSAMIVMVLYGLGEFAIVSILGVRRGFDVFSTAIHEAVRNKFPPAHGEAAALAVSLLLVMFVLVWYYRRVTARKEAYMTLSGSRSDPQTWDLGAWRWPLALGIWVLLLVVWVFPILVLVITSLHTTWTGQIQLTQLTLSHWITPIVDPQLRQSFFNSIVVAVSGATLGTFLVVGTAYYTERTNAPFRGVVDFLSLTPLAVPGIILGSSLLFTFLWAGAITGVLNLYGTLAIIVIGCVMVYLPVSSRIAVGNIVQIHEELEEAARISGASWLDQMREIFLPLFKNTTVVLWFFLALHIVQLLSVPLMTYTADTVVLPVKLYQLYMFQPDLSLVAAISSHFIVLTIALLLGLRLLGVTFYDLDYGG